MGGGPGVVRDAPDPDPVRYIVARQLLLHKEGGEGGGGLKVVMDPDPAGCIGSTRFLLHLSGWVLASLTVRFSGSGSSQIYWILPLSRVACSHLGGYLPARQCGDGDQRAVDTALAVRAYALVSLGQLGQ